MATFVYANSQGQRTHSARTKVQNKWVDSHQPHPQKKIKSRSEIFILHMRNIFILVKQFTTFYLIFPLKQVSTNWEIGFWIFLLSKYSYQQIKNHGFLNFPQHDKILEYSSFTKWFLDEFPSIINNVSYKICIMIAST